MLKLLHLTQRFPPAIGGVERHVYEISKRLAQEYEVDVFASDLTKDRPFTRLPTSFREQAPRRVKVARFRAVRILPSDRGISIVMPNMIPRLVHGGWDIVHSHALSYFVTYASLFSRMRGSRLVVTAHSDPTIKMSRSHPALLPLRKADALIALTSVEKQKFVECGIESDRIFVVPNGIDLEPYRQMPPGSRFRLKFRLGAGPLVLYVGRVDISQKGCDVLIRAMPNVLLAFPTAKFVLAGPDWGSLDILQRIARSFRVDPVFTGQLDQMTLIAAYAAADVVVVPSRIEPFGIVLLEAMASGRPIVASRVGGIPEIVNESNSILTRPGDERELASAINRVLSDNNLAAKLGEAGRRIVNNYSWDRIVTETEKIYREVCWRKP